MKVFHKLTFEQHPPKIKLSMPPTTTNCGIVSMNILPVKAIIFELAGLSLSIPYISAFSRDGAAFMTFGTAVWPCADEDELCKSRRVLRRRGCAWLGMDEVVDELEVELLDLLSAMLLRRAMNRMQHMPLMKQKQVMRSDDRALLRWVFLVLVTVTLVVRTLLSGSVLAAGSKQPHSYAACDSCM